MMLGKIIADHYGPATAQTYDAIAHRFFWGYGETLDAVAAEIVFGRRSHPDLPVRLHAVLDLGTGTGNLAIRLLQTIKASRLFRVADGASHHDSHESHLNLHLYDASASMMDLAKAKLVQGGYDRSILHVGDLIDVPGRLSELRFDCIMSSFAVHHLDAAKKEGLVRDLFGLLNPGGLLVIGDRMQVSDTLSLSGTEYLMAMCSKFAALYADSGERPSFSELLADVERQFDEDGDRPSTVEEHVHWFQSAGFSRVRVPYQSFACAVVSGIRQADPRR